jgi:hypothetical protein
MVRAGLIAAGVVAALAVAGAAAWFLALRDTTEPVEPGEAVTSFRTDTGQAPEGTAPIPEGVYVYETDGFEQTDALLGEKHVYPEETTITVRAADCGASLVWRPVKGRSTEWVFCTAPQGWELASQDERHTFFGRTESTTYVCEDTLVRPPETASAPSKYSCSTGSADEVGTVALVGLEEIQVGGTNVTAEHVRRKTTLSGETRGATTHDTWFDSASGVPVKMVMVSRTTNDSPIGEVNYDERVSLLLTSLEPRR